MFRVSHRVLPTSSASGVVDTVLVGRESFVNNCSEDVQFQGVPSAPCLRKEIPPLRTRDVVLTGGGTDPGVFLPSFLRESSVGG